VVSRGCFAARHKELTSGKRLLNIGGCGKFGAQPGLVGEKNLGGALKPPRILRKSVNIAHEAGGDIDHLSSTLESSRLSVSPSAHQPQQTERDKMKK
jgi:hypothetical protein